MSFEGMQRVLCRCGEDYEYEVPNCAGEAGICPNCQEYDVIESIIYDHTNGNDEEIEYNHQKEKRFERAKTLYYKKNPPIHLNAVLRERKAIEATIKSCKRELSSLQKLTAMLIAEIAKQEANKSKKRKKRNEAK